MSHRRAGRKVGGPVTDRAPPVREPDADSDRRIRAAGMAHRWTPSGASHRAPPRNHSLTPLTIICA